jgi:deferrochelatase/peroxidase EfeB
LATITWERGKVTKEPVDKESADKESVVREPFGFADNISQPAFFTEDLPSNPIARWSPNSQPNVVLAPELGATDNDELGSYMAFLKIQQHIATLDKFAEVVKGTRFAVVAGTHFAAIQPNEMKAYAIGRSLDGDPLVKGDRTSVTKNDFDFTKDPKRQTCPFFAHIRKMNPREDNTHMVVRRGVSYTDPKDGTRGTLFQCFRSSLSNGFEIYLIQLGPQSASPSGKCRTRCNPPSPAGRPAPYQLRHVAGTPCTGAHDDSLWGILLLPQHPVFQPP